MRPPGGPPSGSLPHPEQSAGHATGCTGPAGKPAGPGHARPSSPLPPRHAGGPLGLEHFQRNFEVIFASFACFMSRSSKLSAEAHLAVPAMSLYALGTGRGQARGLNAVDRNLHSLSFLKTFQFLLSVLWLVISRNAPRFELYVSHVPLVLPSVVPVFVSVYCIPRLLVLPGLLCRCRQACS